MADLGDVGLVIRLRVPRVLICRSILTLDAQPTGNGPISNAAPFLASPNATINLNGRRGAQMERQARVPSSGIWTFYDLGPGIYYATEAGVSRQWIITVAADLSFTVAPVTSSFPRTRAWASA